MAHLRLAVLASGRGTNLQSILDAGREGRLDASVAAVVSDKEGAFALERARLAGIPAYYVNPRGYCSKEEYEEALLGVVRYSRADCVVLAGFMRVLSPYFIKAAGVPILNIHPSILPSFPGLHAQRQALEYGVRYSGCTVHFVDEGVDSGPIILQAVVPVLPSDTEESLAARILEKEHIIYPEALQLLCEGRVLRRGRKVIILEEGEINE
ncbi:MAG: phosphoribosylglycinamide formyltransferase [Peptococcaceae bacterium]|jgi:phosphoribosylglycinamide formyltransferase-1|nr:phosphoribosylglycinamide formyltransferase [Peptococcaceae bacterium]MDH7526406.1 phosphoribosylglycinamide formyltransferase [Peptococcaceae bacterium]